MRHHDIVVVGTGFAGLGMAIELKRAGREDFVVLERADAVGGTWRDNHYPGCGCDVPTPLYSYSFAPNPDWSYFYARYDELRDYLEDCTDHFGVRPHIRFSTEVVAAEWQEREQRWRLALSDGSEITARLVIGGFGGLNQPAEPDIPGLESFAGARMHSAGWDHDVPLEGKRVGVIGTGASAVQIVPEVARSAARLHVFQRTPAWVFPKIDRRFSRLEKRMFRRFPATQRLLRRAVFWFSESVAFPIVKQPRASRVLELVALSHMRRQVRDPALRARLRPSYRAGCKRMLPSNGFYPALGRDNVELVTAGIERVEENGVRTADGELHALDVLVSATGFDLEKAFEGVHLTGRGGITIQEKWAEGFAAHRGTMVHGFPNLMFLSGPNTGTGSTSQVYMIQAQIRYVMEALRAMDEHGAAELEVTDAAYDSYQEWLWERMQKTVWLTGGCNSWYLQGAGRGSGVLYPDWSSSFRRRMQSFRPDEHDLSPARAPEPLVPA